jgi:transposase-like protein
MEKRELEMTVEKKTSAFKAKVGLEALKVEKTHVELAQKYQVHPETVGQWKREILEGAISLFEEKRSRKKAEKTEPPERLYEEIGRLKMELDWLKKKSGL